MTDAQESTTAEAGEAVVVRLGAGRFAVALDSVAEVGRVPAVTRIPGGPDWLAGVANWRGRLMPVLDLRGLLGADRTPFASSARLVVLVDDGVSAGLVVEAVEGTGSLGAEIDEFPAAFAGPGAELLHGQVPRDDGPVAVLDPAAVLRLRESLPRARRTA
ncbi:MAG: purine-binding chemotaxis protein CheW [Frankiaceae bacterium]|nr:purine-binding chemotaxis protein CheW [Frankiaceae bacterium]